MVSKAIELIATEPFCLTKPKFQNLSLISGETGKRFQAGLYRSSDMKKKAKLLVIMIKVN